MFGARKFRTSFISVWIIVRPVIRIDFEFTVDAVVVLFRQYVFLKLQWKLSNYPQRGFFFSSFILLLVFLLLDNDKASSWIIRLSSRRGIFYKGNGVISSRTANSPTAADFREGEITTISIFVAIAGSGYRLSENKYMGWVRGLSSAYPLIGPIRGFSFPPRRPGSMATVFSRSCHVLRANALAMRQGRPLSVEIVPAIHQKEIAALEALYPLPERVLILP